MLKKLIIASITTLGLAILLLPKAGLALTLTPTSREVTLTPGQKSIITIKVKNESQEDVQLTSDVAGFTAKNETGEPKFLFKGVQPDIVSWITVSQSQFDLTAGQSKDIDVVIDTPAQAAPGGHYAAVFFNQNIPAQQPGDVNIESKLGSLILATVKGNYTAKGKISDFSAKGVTSTGNKPVSFVVKFKNSGDIHLVPTGKITITNMFGKTVKIIPVNSEQGAVLPGFTRKYDVSKWSNVGNLFGKYTATLTLKSGQVTSSKSIHFWFWSTIGIIISVVALLAVVFLVILLVKLASTKNTPTGSSEQK